MFLLHIIGTESTNYRIGRWEGHGNKKTQKFLGKWFSQVSKPVMWYIIFAKWNRL